MYLGRVRSVAPVLLEALRGVLPRSACVLLPLPAVVISICSYCGESERKVFNGSGCLYRKALAWRFSLPLAFFSTCFHTGKMLFSQPCFVARPEKLGSSG